MATPMTAAATAGRTAGRTTAIRINGKRILLAAGPKGVQRPGRRPNAEAIVRFLIRDGENQSRRENEFDGELWRSELTVLPDGSARARFSRRPLEPESAETQRALAERSAACMPPVMRELLANPDERWGLR